MRYMKPPFDVKQLARHPVLERLVQLLKKTSQNVCSDNFFRVMATFYICQVASTMRAKVKTENKGDILVNMYAFALAPSGFGKTRSSTVLETEILQDFYTNFEEHTLKFVTEEALHKEAIQTANIKGTSYEVELKALRNELASYGSFVFSFPEGSSAAFRQIRGLVQMLGAGSTNFIVDEAGYNITKNSECFDLHMEIYDNGRTKNKIVKSTAESKRWKDRLHPVPSNLLLYGTPEKVFDGGNAEKDWVTRLEAGMARRLTYAYGYKSDFDLKQDAEEVYDSLCQASSETDIVDLRGLFGALADPINLNWIAKIERPEGIELTRYDLWCKSRANEMPEHESIRSSEMENRAFRATKVAGAFAFIDSSPVVTKEHLQAAIRLLEEQSEDFNKILSRPKNYMRLAKLVANTKEEMTHADIQAKLSFYPSSKTAQNDMWNMAISWGHSNNCIIKRRLFDDIEFFSGESLKETDLEHIRFSFSENNAAGYQSKEASIQSLFDLCQVNGQNFCNHHFDEEHRNDKNTIVGCDFIVLDCDGEISIKQFAATMKGYYCHIYTTKSNTAAVNRFRAIIPLKYRIHLSKEDYKAFITSIYDTLPFKVQDKSGMSRCHKWSCNNGSSATLEGELFDPVPYLPNTKLNEERLKSEKEMKKIKHFDKMQRFFAKQWMSGAGRNNTLLKYGLLLIDTGMDIQEALYKVKEFNRSFSDPLDEDELGDSVYRTMGKKYVQQVKAKNKQPEPEEESHVQAPQEK